METLAVNVTGKTRQEKLNGRDYIVAPLTLIVPGVLRGSKGSLYYPQDEVTKDPSVWNSIPIVVYHPTVNGNAVSARDPDVLNKCQVGFVFRANGKSGKLKAEGWFDVELTREIDERVLNALESETEMELSTGLFLDRYPAEEGAVYNGVEYDYVTANYRPDHLAVLPDQIGACSLKDGCGLMVNQLSLNASLVTLNSSSNSGWEVMLVANKLSLDETERAVSKAFYKAHPTTYDSNGHLKDHCWILAIYDNYFIYSENEELYRQSYSISGGTVTLGEESEKVEKVVKYVPSTTTNRFEPQTFEEVLVAKLTQNERNGIIEDLVKNCDCWKDAGDKEVLSGFSDDKLVNLKENLVKSKQLVEVANAAVSGVRDGDTELRINPTTGRWEKRKVQADDDKTVAGNKKTEKDPAEDAKPARAASRTQTEDEPVAANRRSRPQTVDEYIRSAPASLRDQLETTLRTAQLVEQREKDRIVSEILVNVAEPDRPTQREWLMEQSVDQLQRMYNIMPKAPAKDTSDRPKAVTNKRRRNDEEDDDKLGLPTYNWHEVGSKGGSEAPSTNSSHAQIDNDDVLMSDDDYLRNLPPHIRNKFQSALLIEEQERRKLIDEVVSNASLEDDQEAQLIKALNNKNLEELRLLAKISNKPDSPRQRSWFGAAAPAPAVNLSKTSSNDTSEDILPPPSYNWHEANGKN